MRNEEEARGDGSAAAASPAQQGCITSALENKECEMRKKPAF